MPKVKRLRAPALESQLVQHEPLGQVIESDVLRGKYASSTIGRKKRRKEQTNHSQNGNDDNDEYLDEKISRKIIEMSKEQQIEEEIDELRLCNQRNNRRQQERGSKTRHNDDSDSENEIDQVSDELSIENDEGEDYIENDEGYVDVRDGTFGLSAEDEAVVAAMKSAGGVEERKTLADIILQKIKEKEDKNNVVMINDDKEENGMQSLPPKVVEVYTDIGKILSRYTSGKLPKAFKVIPSLSNWEEVLYLTRPDLWTPQAMYASTRIFASNLSPKLAQRFYYLVLLDAIRTDIYQNKRLNYHYYISLKKAVYKPAAFFKGILLPLCREECTLREAAIVASVLQRVSIPVHHSAVAIHKLAQTKEYNGAASIFIKTILNKKYSLPVPVIASLVRHFASFVEDDHDLPVLWHQALLTFCQRYKNEIQDQARESLRLVMKKHYHYKITPEIRRELFGASAWKNERSMAVSSNNHGDEMAM